MQAAVLPLSALCQRLFGLSRDQLGCIFPIWCSTKSSHHCSNWWHAIMNDGLSDLLSRCSAWGINWYCHLRKIKKKRNLKRDLNGWGWGWGPVPRDFTRNFCCYGNHSVCLYLLRATASSRAAQSGNFNSSYLGVWGTSNGDIFSKKKSGVWGNVTEREEEFVNIH